MRTCLDCPADLTGTHHQRKRCQPCAKKAVYARIKAWRQAHPRPRMNTHCKKCGVDITDRHPNAIYCTHCARPTLRNPRQETCLDCKKSIMHRHPTTRRCRLCQQTRNHERMRAKQSISTARDNIIRNSPTLMEALRKKIMRKGRKDDGCGISG